MKQFLKGLDTAYDGIRSAVKALLDEPVLYSALGADTLQMLMSARAKVLTAQLITNKFVNSNISNPAILSAIAEYEADFIGCLLYTSDAADE